MQYRRALSQSMQRSDTAQKSSVVMASGRGRNRRKREYCEDSTIQDEDDSTNPPTKRKRRAFTIHDKIEILDFAKKTSLHAASKHFTVARSTMRVWKKQELDLKKMMESATRKRIQGGGRKPTDADFDTALAEWIKELRVRKLRVSRNMIVTEAQKLVLSWCGRTWMDNELTTKYLEEVFGNFFFGNRLFIWDTFGHPYGSRTRRMERFQMDFHYYASADKKMIMIKLVEEIDLNEDENIGSDFSIEL
uniref:HTH CENPB-type domain-containing protein n=1 Tax=Globodera rostochiensis TaxID=31243 RepID=A0A914HLZ8_GLORO